MAWSKEAAYLPVWGDLEWSSSSTDSFKNYKGRFAVPNSQTSPGSPLAGGKDWYWFDYGNTRFITLPEPWSGAWSAWNATAGDLMAQAQADPNIKFIATFGHRPAYSSGHYTGSPTLKGMLDKLGDTYSKYTLNINGHSNNYERSFPQHGVTHVTVGTGGANLTQDGTCLWLTCAKPAWSAFRAMHLGALKLRFADAAIQGSFICGPDGGGKNDVSCTEGSIVDNFTIASPTVTVAPSAIVTPITATSIIAAPMATVAPMATAAPDVIVTSLSYANGVFKSIVKNQGTAATPAGVSIGVGYQVDGINKTWGSLGGPLAAGASVTIGTNGGSNTIPTGNHTIMAYVDDVNRFTESNETNNQLSQSINSSGASITAAATVTGAAFPGAQGGGAGAVGGRGGAVIEVTNLNDKGTGSLRACAEVATGPRTCVFRVGGTIKLASRIRIINPYLTIAGQTAPGGGIQLSGKNTTQAVVGIGTHDVVLRYLRIRKGYNTSCLPSAQCGQNFNVNGSTTVYNVMYDHLSTAWNQDDSFALWGLKNNVTISYTIVAEGLEGHATGAITGAGTSALAQSMTDIDFHHNYFVGGTHRAPFLGHKSGREVNDIAYNQKSHSTQLYGAMDYDGINNIKKRGPLSRTSYYEYEGLTNTSGLDSTNGSPSMYLSGNIGWNQTSPAGDQWAMARKVSTYNGAPTETIPTAWRRTTPLANTPIPIIAEPVATLAANLMPIVGASQKLACTGGFVANRDTTDTRLVNQYINNTGNSFLVANETQVGGFPVIVNGTPCADADHDAMPDVWEVAHGLNFNSAADRNAIAKNGYTNVENYLNGQ